MAIARHASLMLSSPAVGKMRLEAAFRIAGRNPDLEYPIIDSTIGRAHQHAAGAKGEVKMG
jgi:hypothetical protein